MRLFLLCLTMAWATADADLSNQDLLSNVLTALDTRLSAQQAQHEEALAQQQAKYEKMLADQQASFSAQLAHLQNAIGTEEAQRQRRLEAQVDNTMDSFTGVRILSDNSAVVFGKNKDASIFRVGNGQLVCMADWNVTGTLSLSVDDEQTSVGAFLSELASRMTTVENQQVLAKASLDFGTQVNGVGGSWATPYNIAGIPFGYNDSTVLFDSPHTAKLNEGKLVDGVYTAPTDGIYYVTSKVRVQDTSPDEVEIEFFVNGEDTESFEMWISNGDGYRNVTYGRRSAMSTFLTYLREGDRLYPASDLTTNYGFMGQTDIFQVADDRVAFNVMATGNVTAVEGSLLKMSDDSEIKFITHNDPLSDVDFITHADSLTDGIFTAPREGLYYFACKVRVSDKSDGDMEIKWLKNDIETDGGFEMWLHTGDAYVRRAHMSAMLVDLKQGETVYPASSSVFDTQVVHQTTFSGFELPNDLPAFKVVADGAFIYTNRSEVFGNNVEATLQFERGSLGNYADGIYTVPEDGFYYFTMKIRTGDNDDDFLEIEWKKNGEDASTNNYEMWLSLGDSSNRRTGMSTCFLQCVAGDQIWGTSDLALASRFDIIGSWTFSGFKVG